MKIAIIGLGVVGRGVYEIINKHFAPEIEVKYVMDLRPMEDITCIHATGIDQITADPEVDLVVEAMGGVNPAYEFVSKALAAGKHVVTPNKQMVSTMYTELMKLAKENNVKILYTPSAGGGIPWLYNLVRIKNCGGILNFRGIINGTTNYILDVMEKTGRDFSEILADAQKLGYAEANPSADIDGIDIQRKCAISADLAFNVCLNPDDIDTAGIRYITKEDIASFSAKGLRCKLLCNGQLLEDGSVAAYVEPILLPQEAIEAHVGANFNMAFLNGPEVGELGFFGQGAGRYPTAHSLVEDILDVKCGNAYTWNGKKASVCNSGVKHRYYVRTAAPEFQSLAKEKLGAGFVTDPIAVSEIHAKARAVIAKGEPVFIAAIKE